MTSRTPSTRRRLQRDKDFTGDRLTSFRDVFFRHGLPGCVIALLCLASPQLRMAFIAGLESGLADPGRYFMWCLAIFAGLNLYAWYIDRRWDTMKLGWILYLGRSVLLGRMALSGRLAWHIDEPGRRDCFGGCSERRAVWRGSLFHAALAVALVCWRLHRRISLKPANEHS